MAPTHLVEVADDVAQDGVGHAAVPSAVTVTTTGQIWRKVSGPPVAASSSAASTSASTAVRTASWESRPARQRFLSEPRANTEPDPTAWKSCSSYRPPVTS